MDLDIDLVVYMRILGILIAVVGVVGSVVAAVTIREHNRERDEAKAQAQSMNTWDVESPNSFGHR